MFQLSVGAATHVGLVRTSNEDSVFARPPVFVVADGMGGHAAGEIASQLATSKMAELAEQVSVCPDDVLAAIRDAHRRILQESQSGGRDGMATTLSGVCVVRVDGVDHWMVFNVGDSRVYHLADEILTQVSVDHSEVAELVAVGRLTPEEARNDHRRNVVTRSLGTGSNPQPDVWLLPPSPGERFLICSDGLSSELDDESISSVLSVSGPAGDAAEGLVEAAILAGGRDNVTAVVVELVVC
ncbi:PP2C family protein-serine/threonine phosphatase [uncultured Jatrophihabitans sp.]|uniref:PP2C family protein-serine/threonine phosphatase n=1 Tax=uncultured Jatrophihabitans sp. TaxID=1610747 RepID=UPI0035CAF890